MLVGRKVGWKKGRLEGRWIGREVGWKRGGLEDGKRLKTAPGALSIGDGSCSLWRGRSALWETKLQVWSDVVRYPKKDKKSRVGGSQEEERGNISSRYWDFPAVNPKSGHLASLP